MWSDFSICLWLEFRHYQDVSVIIMYKSVLCIEKMFSFPLPSCSPPPVCSPWICSDSCLLLALLGGRTLTEEGTSTAHKAVSGPTLRKQFIVLTKWCNCFPDSFSLIFHSPQKRPTLAPHKSNTRKVDGNPFLVGLWCCILPLLLPHLCDPSLVSVRTMLI